MSRSHGLALAVRTGQSEFVQSAQPDSGTVAAREQVKAVVTQVSLGPGEGISRRLTGL
jgi:hypothetical protein